MRREIDGKNNENSPNLKANFAKYPQIHNRQNSERHIMTALKTND